jgi:hypothetical protein
MLPGKSPNRANNTIPAPAPKYAVFLEMVVFMIVPSFSFYLAWYDASAVPNYKWLFSRNSLISPICILEKKHGSLLKNAKQVLPCEPCTSTASNIIAKIC